MLQSPVINKCAICGLDVKSQTKLDEDKRMYNFSCSKCGFFSISRHVIGFQDQREKLSKKIELLSNYIKHKSDLTEFLIITTSNLDAVIRDAQVFSKNIHKS